jgi:hypothetical protein
MASSFRPYYPRVYPNRQTAESDDVQRGMLIGSAFGKDLQGLGAALAKGIQEQRQNQIANQLMNTEDAPRAALVSPGGQTVATGGGPQPDGGDTVDPNADLSTDLPEDVSSVISTRAAAPTYTNPSTGNVESIQGPGYDDQTISGTNTSQLLSDNIAQTRAANSLSTKFVPNTIAPGVSTAGTAPHTGGVQELDLRKEMLAQRLAQAKATADAADRQAEASGTGRYALEAAQKRATLEKTQMEIAAGKNKPAKEEKNPPAVNIGSEPVTDQNQLSKHFDGIYGNGTFSDVMSSLSNPDTAPQEIKDSNGVTTAVTVGPEKNRITIPIGDAQTYVKQQNVLRLKQGLSAFRVPGEDQSVGATAANPYPAKTNLDVYSRAPGTWVRLPNGKVAQVPGKQ